MKTEPTSQEGLTLHHLELARPDLKGMRINAALSPGDFLVVVGRNGAGKSTLLQTIMSLLPPAQGEVWLGEDQVAELRPRDRAARMSLVTSTPPRHAGITVRATMELALRAAGLPVDRSSVEDGMKRAGIAVWADRRLDHLSDGMAQRVMVARAALQGREVMVLDEPTAFLDVVGKEDILSQLHHCRTSGTIVVLASHDLDAVAASGAVTHWLHLHPGSGLGSTFHEGGFAVQEAREALRREHR
jgi:iron complex transport system ATP-binding protein